MSRIAGNPLPSLKIAPKNLVIVLVEADEANLQIVLLVVGGRACLTSHIGGAAVFGGGDGSVVGFAVVVAAIVVVEGRNRGHEMRVEGVHPGEEHAGVGFVLAVAQADAWVLWTESVCGD